MNRKYRQTIAAFAVMAIATATHAQPANNDCANAIPLANGSVTPFDMTGCTRDGVLSCANFGVAIDMWYTYTASGPELVTVELCDSPEGTSTRRVLAAYVGGCGGQQIACSRQNDCGLARPRITFNTLSAGTFLIGVASLSAPNTLVGSLRLNAVPAAPPSFTPPADAIPEPGNICDFGNPPGSDVNGGCHPDGTRHFTQISLCTARRGHAASIGTCTTCSDADNYSFTLTEPGTITVVGQAQFIGHGAVLRTPDCETIFFYGTDIPLNDAYYGVDDFSMTTEVLAPGEYFFSIANDQDVSATCEQDNEYWFRITSSVPCPPTCPADLGVQGGLPGHDGLLDNNDFVIFIDYFFNANPAADFGVQGGLPGHDGLFDNNDFIVFIDAFFDGCP